MKTKNALLLILSFFMLLGIGGCKDKEDSAGLKGTKWKLSGIVEVKSATLTELEPKDCEKCYTIDFNTETKGTGRSILNTIEVDLSNAPFFGGMTKVGDNEIGNVSLFYNAISFIEYYTRKGDELSFFYNNGQYYLLYKLYSHEENNF
ncbi:hypothetical protein [Parabacteroides sp. Marseille-P3160]|uniref:hypothetical protein n=1 Tax=Parabacteroides sp. Marseille-P3160 TaxID=1917887 RepID=UPI0009BB7278|nr:hypothetical protein [Parabacteroides sp. Marseille-P3160]